MTLNMQKQYKRKKQYTHTLMYSLSQQGRVLQGCLYLSIYTLSIYNSNNNYYSDFLSCVHFRSFMLQAQSWIETNGQTSGELVGAAV